MQEWQVHEPDYFVRELQTVFYFWGLPQLLSSRYA